MMKRNIFLIAIFFLILLTACQQSANTSASEDDIAEEYARRQRSVTYCTPGKPTLLLVGDSRVQLWPDNFFADDFQVTNIGVGGTVAAFSAFAIQAQTKRYDYIIISTGVNDHMNNYDYPETIYALGCCIIQAKAKSSNVFITTIPGTIANPNGTETGISYQACQVNSYIPWLANMHNVPVIPLAELLCGGSMSINPAYDDGSGIHYNMTAYQLIYELYMSFLQPE